MFYRRIADLHNQNLLILPILLCIVVAGCQPQGNAISLPETEDGTRIAQPEHVELRSDGRLFVIGEQEAFTGKVERYYPESQQLKTVQPYVNGLIEGTETRWHKNGNRSTETEWVSGQRSGLFQAWYEDGTKLESTEFKDNLRHGFARKWDEQGQQLAEEHYYKGRLSDQNQYESPYQVINSDAENQYVGALSCASCHLEKYQGFVHTAHHLTSRLADQDSVMGHFSGQKSEMTTVNENLIFKMMELSDGYYQVAETRDGEQIKRQSAKLDLVFGSGKIAQTFLHWHGTELFELPITYFTEIDSWTNSPGYKDGKINFWRPVIGRCLECHATFFEETNQSSNSFNRERFVLGISCEKCHGPGEHHVNYHLENMDDTVARHIAHPGKLDRQRSLEVCAQCHSGHGKMRTPSFTFRPGKSLEDYIELEEFTELNKIGVHSNNQLPRLSKSECFIKDDSMTCATCHDPHQFERGNTQLFSDRCMNCHEPQTCGMAEQVGERISENCVDCHMPKRRDLGTPLISEAGIVYPLMREHFVTIYPEDSEKVLEQWEAEPKLPESKPAANSEQSFLDLLESVVSNQE